MQFRFDWWRGFMMALVGYFILLMMYGCKATKYVSVETIAKDTTTYAHWDFVFNERVKVIRDSLLSFRWEQSEKQIKDSTYIQDNVRTRVDDKGNVLGKDSVHIEIRYKDSKELVKIKDSLSRYKEIADSSLIYKGERDSLLRLQSTSEKERVYVEKEQRGMDLFYFKLRKFLFWTLALSIVGLFLLFIIRKKLG